MHAYIHINDLAVSEKVPMKNRTYIQHIRTYKYMHIHIYFHTAQCFHIHRHFTLFGYGITFS